MKKIIICSDAWIIVINLKFFSKYILIKNCNHKTALKHKYESTAEHNKWLNIALSKNIKICDSKMTVTQATATEITKTSVNVEARDH